MSIIICPRSQLKTLEWIDRLRIAKELSSAILFLHTAKPYPIIHNDINPGNIFLDYTLSTKLSCVGLFERAPGLSVKNVAQ